jgi:chloride channel 3/4/5
MRLANEGKRREILSASSAAGVAVAFAAPIGGVLFSLEEVSYYFPPKTMWRAFFCAVTAAMSLKVSSPNSLIKFLNPNGSGKIVLFEVSYQRGDWHSTEILVFIFLGVSMGIYGAVFCKLNILWSRTFRQLHLMKKHPVLEVVLVVLVTAVVGYYNPYTRLSGTRLVADLLSECSDKEGLDGVCPQNVDEIPDLINLMALAMIIKIGLYHFSHLTDIEQS